MSTRRWFRSVLFVPGHQGDRIGKAARSGADAVLVDLEDAVPISRKDEARHVTATAIGAYDGPVAMMVRLNGWGDGALLEDLDAVVVPGLFGVALPKCDGPDHVAALDLVLGELEQRRGLPAGAIEILPMLETAAGMRRNFETLQSSPRVRRAGGVIGAAPGGDYHRALGNQWGPDGLESLFMSSRAVLDARAAGIGNIICGPCTDVRDTELLRSVMTMARRLGATGAQAIHPAQVALINEIFSPSHADVEEAGAVLSAMADAVANGLAAVVLDGKMIDYAHVRWARVLLERAESLGMDVGVLPDVVAP